ncbi:related to Spherulin 4 precursor [Melanopsichium pennsylvanicum]|uniref:Related to Spherulin 4 n=1 Tax=Melanopsichium pennsylvanicum TaxID=63383 RepID=A0AAJ4XS72_9BASI|nr:related to Spherulin 4 precursor [Melanopsichium pennsylvanicum]
MRRPCSSQSYLLFIIAMLSALFHFVAPTPFTAAKDLQERATTVNTSIPRIILPLYIYPNPKSVWEPLFTAIKSNPTVAFTIIINPNSGPGKTNSPASNYVAAIENLRSVVAPGQVVRLIGYVPTGYGKRGVDKVKADVNRYAGWPSAVKMDGIFFDETITSSQYLSKYTQYTALVKNIKTWANNSTPGITVLNPGTWPQDPHFFNIPGADHIVIYEDKLSNFNYAQYKQKNCIVNQQQEASCSHSVSEKFHLLQHSFVQSIVNGLDSNGGLFITNLDIADNDVYASFSSIWQAFINSVASLSHQKQIVAASY